MRNHDNSINSRSSREGLFKSIMLAYTILILHVLLLAGVALLVLFFAGLVRYIFWILFGGFSLITLSAYLFYRRLKKEGKSMREALRTPMFQGRSVEISLFGGMASMRLGAPNRQAYLEDSFQQGEPHRLEDPETVHLREIETLAGMLEKKLITPEEFDVAKQKFLRS